MWVYYVRSQFKKTFEFYLIHRYVLLKCIEKEILVTEIVYMIIREWDTFQDNIICYTQNGNNLFRHFRVYDRFGRQYLFLI